MAGLGFSESPAHLGGPGLRPCRGLEKTLAWQKKDTEETRWNINIRQMEAKLGAGAAQGPLLHADPGINWYYVLLPGATWFYVVLRTPCRVRCGQKNVAKGGLCCTKAEAESERELSLSF